MTNLSGGQSLHQHGGLFGPASAVAWALLDFIKAGRATAHPNHAGVADLESTVSGGLLVEIIREAEKRTGRRLLEEDGSATIGRVNRTDRYCIRFIEF
jgi:hypothetical protein